MAVLGERPNFLVSHERVKVTYSVVTQNQTPVGGAKFIVVGPAPLGYVPQRKVADERGKAEFNLIPGEYFFFIESTWGGYCAQKLRVDSNSEPDAILTPYPKNREAVVYTFDDSTSKLISDINVSATVTGLNPIIGTSSSGTYTIPLSNTDPDAKLSITIKHPQYEEFSHTFDPSQSIYRLISLSKLTPDSIKKPTPMPTVPPPTTTKIPTVEPPIITTIPTVPPKTEPKTPAVPPKSIPKIPAPKTPIPAPKAIVIAKLEGKVKVSGQELVVGSLASVTVSLRYLGGTNPKATTSALVVIRDPKGKLVLNQSYSQLLSSNIFGDKRIDFKPMVAGKYSLTAIATADGFPKWKETIEFSAGSK